MTLLLLLALILGLFLYLAAYWLHRRGWPAWQRDVLAAGLLVLACVGYFWRILFGAATMPADGGDLVSFLWPAYRFAADSLQAGHWPLWNPHLYGGAPHVADIQAGFLYPINLLLFLLNPDFAPPVMAGLSILHLWWAGLGMYVFVRSLRWQTDAGQQERLGRAAALAAGLAFAFSDPLWTHFGNLNFIAVASWLPWVMICWVKSLEAASRARLGWAAAGGLLLGIGTLAGHIQATLFIGLAAMLYGLFWLWGEMRQEQPAGRGDLQPLWRLLTHIALLAVVAFLIASPVLLPTLQLTRFSARAGWTYQETVGFSLSPAQWIGLLIPGFFGRGPQLHWGPWPRVEVGYLGVLPLALVALALLARRDRRTWTLVGLGGVAFLLALGIYSTPHGWLSLLPGFGQLRAPARLTLLLDFGLAALAGLGLHVLVSPLGERENWRALTRLADGLRWAAKVVLAVVTPLTLGALLLAQDKDPLIYTRLAVTAIAVFLFIAFLLGSLALVAARKAGWARPRTLAALALALIFLDLASTGAYFDIGDTDPAQGFDQPAIAAFLGQQEGPFRIDARTDVDQLWQPNTALLYGLDDVWGVANPSLLAHYERYWEGMGSRSSRLYDFLNAGYVIGRKDVVLDWDKFELAFDGDPALNVYRNRQVLPRAFVVHEVQTVADAAQAWAAIQASGFDPGRQAVVERGDALLPAPTPATGAESTIWLERTGHELALEVTTTAPGYLVLSEVWYPGWQAEVTVNGRTERQPVLPANYAFRAIPLWQAGVHEVRLRFAPAGWRIGLLLGGLTAMALLLAAGWAWARR